METYNVVFNTDDDVGVYSISLVHDPAMSSHFIALNKQQIQLAEVDEKKHILAGVVLIPDKDVYRNQDGKEFNIRFSKETIEQVANNFIKEGYQGNSSLEHKEKINGVSIVQSWVVKDPKNDTANAYGLPKEDIKEGSWIALYKCDNKEIYNKALKGEIKGFSIDGLFSLEKINLKSDVMTKEDLVKFKDDLLSEFKAVFSKETVVEEEVEIKLGTATLKDGATQIEYMGETMEAGQDVFIVSGEEKAPLPAGEYPLDNGTLLVVVEDGKIGEVKEMAEEAEELNEDPSPSNITDEFKQLMKSLTIKYAEETKENIGALEKKITEKFEAELAKQADMIEELKKSPAVVALRSAPEQKKYADMTNFEKLKYNRENS